MEWRLFKFERGQGYIVMRDYSGPLPPDEMCEPGLFFHNLQKAKTYVEGYKDAKQGAILDLYSEEAPQVVQLYRNNGQGLQPIPSPEKIPASLVRFINSLQAACTAAH